MRRFLKPIIIATAIFFSTTIVFKCVAMYPHDSIIENNLYSNFGKFEEIKNRALLESDYSFRQLIGDKTYNVFRYKRKYGAGIDNDEVTFYYEKNIMAEIVGGCSEKGIMYTTDEITNNVFNDLNFNSPKQPYEIIYKKTKFKDWYLFLLSTCG